MTIIGIDPGKKGGFAVLGTHPGACPLPYAGDTPDGAWLADRFRALADPVLYMEKVHAAPGQGVVSMFTFGRGYGYILGVACAMGVPVVLVTPQKWKAEVLAGTAKDKEAAIAWCRRTYPRISLVPPGCRTPQDGMADALCIAHYGALQQMLS